MSVPEKDLINIVENSRMIRKFIQINYLEMYEKWAMDSPNGFFDNK